MDDLTETTPAATIVEAVNVKKTYIFGKVPVNARWREPEGWQRRFPRRSGNL